MQAYGLQQLFFPGATADISPPLGTSTCVLPQTREGSLSSVGADERSDALAAGIARMLWVVARAAAKSVPDVTSVRKPQSQGASSQPAGCNDAEAAATGPASEASAPASTSSAAAAPEGEGSSASAGEGSAAEGAPQAVWVSVAAAASAAVSSACSVASADDFVDPFEAAALDAAPSGSVPCLQTETFESEAALAEAVRASSSALSAPGSPAVVCLLMSLLLTRGVHATAKEARVDPMLASLIYRDGCSEQALLNLCLTGRAVNDVAAQHWVDWTGSPLIGFLTDADGFHVADCFQLPTLPIFVLNSGGHYTTAFCPNPAAAAVDKTPPPPPQARPRGRKGAKGGDAQPSGDHCTRPRAGSAEADIDATSAAVAAAETAAMLEAALGPEGAAEALSLAGMLAPAKSPQGTNAEEPGAAPPALASGGAVGGPASDAKVMPAEGASSTGDAAALGSAAAAASGKVAGTAPAETGADSAAGVAVATDADADGVTASAAASEAAATAWRLDPPIFTFLHLNGLRPLHADGNATRESSFRLALFGEFSPSTRAGGKPPKGVASPAGQQADNKARKIKKILQHRVAPGGSKEGGPFEFLVVCEAKGSMEDTGADVPPYWPARWYCRDCTLKGEWGAYNAAEALECVLCSRPARECGWAHWLSEDQLPKGMLKDWHRSHAPAALKVMRVRWPRADAEWDGAPPALFG